MELIRFNVTCPLGADEVTLSVTVKDDAVTRIGFGAGEVQGNKNAPALLVEQELKSYFAGTLREFTVPCAASGTDFQRSVWRVTAEIPYGETMSYKAIAARAGKPGVARAVGMALNKNPLPIIVPCHRVTGSDGSLIGYAGGLELKRELIILEARQS